MSVLKNSYPRAAELYHLGSKLRCRNAKCDRIISFASFIAEESTECAFCSAFMCGLDTYMTDDKRASYECGPYYSFIVNYRRFHICDKCHQEKRMAAYALLVESGQRQNVHINLFREIKDKLIEKSLLRRLATVDGSAQAKQQADSELEFKAQKKKEKRLYKEARESEKRKRDDYEKEQQIAKGIDSACFELPPAKRAKYLESAEHEIEELRKDLNEAIAVTKLKAPSDLNERWGRTWSFDSDCGLSDSSYSDDDDEDDDVKMKGDDSKDGDDEDGKDKESADDEAEEEDEEEASAEEPVDDKAEIPAGEKDPDAE